MKHGVKISVVTVCFNEEKTIRKTIESVLEQDYPDYEYVIMDGLSNDSTMDIVNEYSNNEHLFAYSEKDNGLYDAMNKSLDRISGDYVLFLNSGDWLYARSVLSEVAKYLTCDVVYGDVYRRTSAGSYLQKYRGSKTERIVMMLCGLAFCHQTQFTRTEVMREYRFRESHRITADFDLVVRLMRDHKSFYHIDRVICSFDNEEGISAQKENYWQMTREDDESIRECFPFLYHITIIPKRIYRILFSFRRS